MIKTIIKRDGTKEEFSPDKINGWGIWASEALGDRVSWPSVVLDTVSTLPEECTSELLQNRLIKVCLEYNTYSYHLMAGKLYSNLLTKTVYPEGRPSILELHSELIRLERMECLNHSVEDYQYFEVIIDHSRDSTYAHGSLEQIRQKYSIKDRITGKVFETAQFVFMRLAMALGSNRIEVEDFYNHFSLGRVSCPTPNYVNLGTPLHGLSSCCVYTVEDSAKSLAIGDHIAYTMTYMSAGIGSHLNIRSIGDPVRNGAIKHLGKLPYYKALAGAVTAQMQNGRGGACTTYFTLYDPEVATLLKLKNQKTPENKKVRGLDYSFGLNRFFAAKAAKNELVFTFNSFTAPELYKCLYSSDYTENDFITEYNKLLEDPLFNKVFINARDVLLLAINESYETGKCYPHFITEMNCHTPFNEVIYSSNLCTEIFLPTSPYLDMRDLYSTEDHGRGEVAMCNLAGLCPSNIANEKEYASAAYYALLMIDQCIHKTTYELPHIGVTTKSRMNAGVGIIGLAHALAKEGVKYSEEAGKEEINKIAERHYWHLLNASLRLGKEKGNAPWIDKTKWPDGYLPYDTSNTSVEDLIDTPYHYYWEDLRDKIVENGGIRNSVLVAHMPTESSSKAIGLPNGLYPIRELTLSKTDNASVIQWAAKDGEALTNNYEMAYDISAKDYTEVYSIIQKWTDQGISADYYETLIGQDTLSSTKMLETFFYMLKMGLKSRYYINSKTSEAISLGEEFIVSEEDIIESAQGCESGACTL